MQPQSSSSPPAEPVRVEILKAPDPKRDVGWWFTIAGPVVVAALALVVAIISLANQAGANKNAESATDRMYAAQVSFLSPPPGSAQYAIENHADVQINTVLVQRAAHANLMQLGTIDACTRITISLTSASSPAIYFVDAAGNSWKLPVDGYAQPSADPATIFSLVPRYTVSLIPAANAPSQKLQGC